jgi:hypothetical protein
VALLLDEDPCHTAKASLREAEGMTLLWLPKRSPKLNPMDTLWGQGKDVISANKQYATIDEQVDRFLGHLRSLTNQEALHTSGALSKKFWLKHYFPGKSHQSVHLSNFQTDSPRGFGGGKPPPSPGNQPRGL